MSGKSVSDSERKREDDVLRRMLNTPPTPWVNKSRVGKAKLVLESPYCVSMADLAKLTT